MLKNFYNKTAKSYNDLHEEEQLKKLRIIKQVLKPKKSLKVLDVGCGTGLSKMLGCKITGVDSSAELLKQAAIPIIRGKAEKLPFKNNSFDAIICVTAIHNFKNPKKAINEMKRVTTQKAIIIISLLKKSNKFSKLKNLIRKELTINKIIEEEKDEILFCAKHKK